MQHVRYPYRLLWLVHRDPHVRCSKRQQVAKELLQATTEDLEMNARKLKKMCSDELQHVVEHGSMILQATSQGSMLYAIVSTWAESLKVDTQLVESINSLVRLIGTRCPSIDLDTMSARITAKKAVAGHLVDTSATSKRWSNVEKHAKPLLLEMSSAGNEYQKVLRDATRFAQPSRVSLAALDPSLQNTDLSKALPDLVCTPERSWATAGASKIKRALEQARRESSALKKFAALRPASLTVLAARPHGSTGAEQVDFYLQCASYRSVLFITKLRQEVDGPLSLADGKLNMTTTTQLLSGLHTTIHSVDVTAKYDIVALSALHHRGTSLMCIGEDPNATFADLTSKLCTVQQSLADAQVVCCIEQGRIKPHAQAIAGSVEPAEGEADAEQAEADAPDDAELLLSGYEFGNEVEESVQDAAGLDEELGTHHVQAGNARAIQKVVSKGRSKGSGDQPPAGPVDVKDVGLLDDAVALVRSMHGMSSLTDAELEEEALLMVIRQIDENKKANQRKNKAAGSNMPDEVQLLIEPDRSGTRAEQSNRYKCFQSDGQFLQEILAEGADAHVDEDLDASETLEAPDAGASLEGDGAGSASTTMPSARRPPKVFVVWLKAATATLNCLDDRFERCGRGAGFQEEISVLASLPQDLRRPHPASAATADDASTCALEIVCVKWTKKRQGRPVRIDAGNRLVWAPTKLFGSEVQTEAFPTEYYDDLLHASGAQSRRYKGNLRDAFPEAVARFLAFSRLICSLANHEPWLRRPCLVWYRSHF